MHRLDFERMDSTDFFEEFDEAEFFDPPKHRSSRGRGRPGGRRKRAAHLRNHQWTADDWAREDWEEQAWADDEWPDLDQEP